MSAAADDGTTAAVDDLDDVAAKEAAAFFKIHGVDQRSPELLFQHDALGTDVTIRMRQDGSTSAAFLPGTSTVIWPCAYSLGDFLCDASVEATRGGDASGAESGPPSSSSSSPAAAAEAVSGGGGVGGGNQKLSLIHI